jgi:hypothetical protein
MGSFLAPRTPWLPGTPADDRQRRDNGIRGCLDGFNGFGLRFHRGVGHRWRECLLDQAVGQEGCGPHPGLRKAVCRAPEPDHRGVPQLGRILAIRKARWSNSRVSTAPTSAPSPARRSTPSPRPRGRRLPCPLVPTLGVEAQFGEGSVVLKDEAADTATQGDLRERYYVAAAYTLARVAQIACSGCAGPWWQRR